MDSLSILLFSCHFIKHICDFFGWCFCSQTEDNDHHKADSKTYSQRIKSSCQDTLWDIAKMFYTTMEDIRKLNDLGEGEVKPRQTLLVVKNSGGN